jgi:hypothetical protein
VATNHDVWDAVEQSDGTPGNSFEFLLAIQAARTGPYVQTADITNVNPAFSGKSRPRQTYGAKGVDLAQTYARNLVLTFDMEVVRDENGAFQPELQDLLVAARSLGVDNRRRIQAYDALGADYAFQSEFSIEHNRTNTDWDSAAFFTFTATQFTPTEWITNPVLTGNVPIITSVAPLTPVAVTEHLFVIGENFWLDGAVDVIGAASVKVGATNATSYTVPSDNLIDLVMPAGSAGATYVRVTNTAGVSQDFPITRGA